MAALDILLRSMGIDINPEDVMQQYEKLKIAIPEFIAESRAKISSMEENQRKILELLQNGR